MSRRRKPLRTRVKSFAITAVIYLMFGWVASGNYPGRYHEYAKTLPIAEDWESHDVIHDVVSAHFQNHADEARVTVDGESRRIFRTPRTMYLCVEGRRHGQDAAETYQIRVPMRSRTEFEHWEGRVSHALFLSPGVVDDDCETEFRNDVVEIPVQRTGPVYRSKRLLTDTSYTGLDIADQIRTQGFPVPERWPEERLPFVFVYSLENANHRTPQHPAEFERVLPWPAEQKHVYIGFYDKRGWRIAGTFYESRQHVRYTVKGFFLKLADALVAPLYLLLGLLLVIFGVRVG